MKITETQLRKIIEEAVTRMVYGVDDDRGFVPIRGSTFDPGRVAAMETGQVMKSWQKHAENWYMLSFYRLKGNPDERMAATQELGIADRKLAFWEKHPNFDRTWANKILDGLKKKWKVTTDAGLAAREKETSRKSPAAVKDLPASSQAILRRK